MTDVSLQRMQDLVRQAIEDGLLATTSSATQIRAHLRAGGLRCTPAQARALRDELGPAPQAGADDTTVGGRLASARHARGLTRVELARIVACSESYLSYLEADARSPSGRLLLALAEAVRREPDWLVSGEESVATRRITTELQLAWEAFRAAEWERLDRHVARVLDEDPGRPLMPHEREAALLLRGRSLGATGREREAIEVLTPLVRRVLAGRSELSPVVVGQGYVRALLNADDRNTETLARAFVVGQQLLAAAGAERDDDWWRLAATLMAIPYGVSPVSLAAAQGEWWLAELRREGEARHPAGAAALYWNLAITDLDRGRGEAALEKISVALALHDPNSYPTDGARLALAHAEVLLATRPERWREVLRLLDECHHAVSSHCYTADRWGWVLLRARARLAAGDLDLAHRTLAELLDDAAVAGPSRGQALLLLGDILRRSGRAADAGSEYGRAASVLLDAAPSPSSARLWRGVGDRWNTLGNAGAAADAYRHALDLLQLPASRDLD